MGNTTLSVPSIIINNDIWNIVPNSFKYDGGEGEINVRSASSGGEKSTSIHSVNAESQIGGCSFDMYLTPDLDSKISILKSKVGSNSIQAVQGFTDGTSVVLSFDNQSCTDAIEREASADGVVKLVFKGDQKSAS